MFTAALDQFVMKNRQIRFEYVRSEGKAGDCGLYPHKNKGRPWEPPSNVYTSGSSFSRIASSQPDVFLSRVAIQENYTGKIPEIAEAEFIGIA